MVLFKGRPDHPRPRSSSHSSPHSSHHDVLCALSQNAERLTARWVWAWTLTLSAPFLSVTYTRWLPCALVCVGAWALRLRLKRARNEAWRARRLDVLARAEGAIECALARLSLTSEADDLTRLKACEASARLPAPLSAHLSPLPARACLTSLLCSGAIALTLPSLVFESPLTPELESPRDLSRDSSHEFKKQRQAHRIKEDQHEALKEALKKAYTSQQQHTQNTQQTSANRAKSASTSAQDTQSAQSAQVSQKEDKKGATQGLFSVTSVTAQERQKARELTSAQKKDPRERVSATPAHSAGAQGRQAPLTSYQLSSKSALTDPSAPREDDRPASQGRSVEPDQRPLRRPLPPLPLRDEATLSDAERAVLERLRAQLSTSSAR